MKLRWPWRRHNGHDSAITAAQAEASLRRTQRLTPAIERTAAEPLGEREYVDRVARAFGRWRPT